MSAEKIQAGLEQCMKIHESTEWNEGTPWVLEIEDYTYFRLYGNVINRATALNDYEFDTDKDFIKLYASTLERLKTAYMTAEQKLNDYSKSEDSSIGIEGRRSSTSSDGSAELSPVFSEVKEVSRNITSLKRSTDDSLAEIRALKAERESVKRVSDTSPIN